MIPAAIPDPHQPMSDPPHEGVSGTEEPTAGRWESLKPRIRLAGSVAIALLAILGLALLGPDSDATDSSSDRMVIWMDDSLNQENATGAPQQTVVNGWTGNALLDTISQQLDHQRRSDHRIAVLLTLGVLLLALNAATTPADARPGTNRPQVPDGRA